MRVCSLEACFTLTKILSSASSLFHDIKDDVSRPVPLVTTFSLTVDTATLSCVSLTTTSSNITNVIQFVGRRQLPLPFLRNRSLLLLSLIHFFDKLFAKNNRILWTKNNLNNVTFLNYLLRALPHAIPFLRNKMPYSLLKSSKTYTV